MSMASILPIDSRTRETEVNSIQPGRCQQSFQNDYRPLDISRAKDTESLFFEFFLIGLESVFLYCEPKVARTIFLRFS